MQEHTHKCTLSSLQPAPMGARALWLDAGCTDEYLAWGQTHSACLLGSEKKRKNKAFMHRHLMALMLHYSLGSILDNREMGQSARYKLGLSVQNASLDFIFQICTPSVQLQLMSPVPCGCLQHCLWQLPPCSRSSSSTLGGSLLRFPANPLAQSFGPL